MGGDTAKSVSDMLKGEVKHETRTCPMSSANTFHHLHFGFCMFGKKLLLTETYFELPKL